MAGLSTPSPVTSPASWKPFRSSSSTTKPSVQATKSMPRAESSASPRGPFFPQPVFHRATTAREPRSMAKVSSRSSRFV